MTSRSLIRSADFFVEDLQNETLLYKTGSQTAIYLNETAALVWKLCDGTRSLKDIVELLIENFPDAKGSLPHDVEETVAMLLDKGALVVEE
jgi:pyrroloquinoline quinone biosynthesis protein D